MRTCTTRMGRAPDKGEVRAAGRDARRAIVRARREAARRTAGAHEPDGAFGPVVLLVRVRTHEKDAAVGRTSRVAGQHEPVEIAGNERLHVRRLPRGIEDSSSVGTLA